MITFIDSKKPVRTRGIPFAYPQKGGVAPASMSTKQTIEFLAQQDYFEMPKSAVSRKKNIARITVVFVLSLFCAFLLLSIVPAIQRSLKLYSLRSVSFTNQVAVSDALRAAVFPETTELSEKEESARLLPQTLSGVHYQQYTIRKGDTIGGIARRFGINQGSLLSVNGIGNARRIQIGEKLRIPSMDGISVKVRRGDTLDSLAKKYNLTVTNVLDANDLTDSTLKIGQELFLPGASLSTFDLRKAMGELFLYPIRGRLTSRFGYRADPFTGRRSFHTGIDLAAPRGTPIRATLDGRVAETGYSRIYGYYVIINHSGHYQSLYGHMSKIYARRGQYVSQGTRIGAVGSTGYSTGNHVHLSIYKYGKLVNPLRLLH